MDPTSFNIPGAPTKPSNVVEVTEATFDQEVVQRSRTVPVVLDLWASWCAPCRQLTPVLEKLNDEGNGSWVLAKIDVDANPQIAQALQVQGIPAVKAVMNAEIVSEFTGALPEVQVRQWLGQFVGRAPGPAEEAAEEEPAELPEELVSSAKTADVAAMRARLAADPNDLGAAIALSTVDLVEGRPREAFARLLDVVRRTTGNERDAARDALVTLMGTVPAGDPAVVSARRDLANALF